jgi:carboxypeptidase PM20D1
VKKILLTAFAALVVLFVVLVVRTVRHQPPPHEAVAGVTVPVDADAVAQHLAQAIQFETVSNEAPLPIDPTQFEGFIDWVKTTYPDVVSRLGLKQIDNSLLLTWRGSDQAAQPILLTAHYDVVPVIAGTEEKWQQPPFSGAIVDGVVWGRGALDDKSAVVTMLEAVNSLLKQGFAPARTVYFSFGHDEELGGKGAAGVTSYLREQNVRLLWTLDEGSFLFNDMLPGITTMVAPINVAEKGSLTINIVAKGQGGHSSMPPHETAVGTLARAVVTLEEHLLPGALDGLSGQMFDTLSRYMPFGPRLLFANRWLFEPLLERQLGNSAFGNAMLRTTTAPTMLSGSPKSNVLPIEATATVNFRLHPRDSVDSVTEFVKRWIASDQVDVRPRGGNPASRVSSWDAVGFTTIGRGIREVYGDVAVVPGLMIAASDTRHYGEIADNSYRFNPMIVSQNDIAGFHGTNEKISVDNLVRATQTYIRIIQLGTSPSR